MKQLPPIAVTVKQITLHVALIQLLEFNNIRVYSRKRYQNLTLSSLKMKLKNIKSIHDYKNCNLIDYKNLL